MRHIRVALARLRGMFAGQRRDDDLREELESHLEMETAELIRRGLDPETARRQALLASGGLTQAAEAVREQRGLPWIENAMADIRYGLRSLRRNPGFTAVVVITLALGIGATTAIFSVVRGVLLKPLPHRDGDRLVYLRQSTDGLGGENMLFSVPEVRDLRTGAPAFAGLAEYSPWDAVLQGDADVTSLQRRSRHRQLLRGHGPLPGARPAHPRERRRSWGPARDGADPRALDPPLRRRIPASSAAGSC